MVAAAVLAVALVALGGCSDGDGGRAGPQGGGATTSPPTAGARFAFTLVAADVQAMAPQAPPFPEEVKGAVTSSLDTWLGNGVVTPLRSGKPPAGLEGAFTARALARLAAPGADRAALLEEGAPLSGEVTQDRAGARLTALTAPGGEVAVVTAQIDVAHTVRAGGQAVAVVRAGEVVLVPDGGAWRIDAYDVRTSRDTVDGGGS